MKQTTCAGCEKEIEERDAFFLDYIELADLTLNENFFIGKSLCLQCYMQKKRNSQLAVAHIH